MEGMHIRKSSRALGRAQPMAAGALPPAGVAPCMQNPADFLSMMATMFQQFGGAAMQRNSGEANLTMLGPLRPKASAPSPLALLDDPVQPVITDGRANDSSPVATSASTTPSSADRAHPQFVHGGAQSPMDEAIALEQKMLMASGAAPAGGEAADEEEAEEAEGG
eukprot:661733-Pyramimonas_sp.AAC.1